MFGPPQRSSSALRPFGSAIIDGFDFDFEAPTQHISVFASRLRNLMDTTNLNPRKRYLLTAAPQCPYPDHAMDSLLQTVPLDFISVQFYNNYCSTSSFIPSSTPTQNTGNSFNFQTWDNWARTAPNPRVKILVGVPGSPTAAGSGYVHGEQLGRVVRYARGFGSFGGVMVWDMSQVQGNGGFLEGVERALGGGGEGMGMGSGGAGTGIERGGGSGEGATEAGGGVGTGTAPKNGAGSVPRWGQCGGRGYSGPTGCEAPYACVHQSEWWAHCN